MAQVGPILREMREASGLPQWQVAERMGVHRVSVHRWESDQSPISLDNFLAFCEAAEGNAVRAVAQLKMARLKEKA